MHYLFLVAGADTGRVRCFGLWLVNVQSVLSAQPITDWGGPAELLDCPLCDKTADLGLFSRVLLPVETA